MQNSKILKTILLVLGGLLLVLGAWRVGAPVSFYANSGIALTSDPAILSEARGAGGVVVGFGLLTLLGIFVRRLTFTSTVAATVLFLSYGFARLLGLVMDGDPGPAIMQGIAFEFLLGGVGAAALIRYRGLPSRSRSPG